MRKSAPPVPPADEPAAPPAEEPPGTAAAERRLDAVLRALPDAEFSSLVGRTGVALDPKKRIDLPAQAARALVRLPDVREPARLPPVSAALLCRIAEADGSLVVASVPVGLDVLVHRGIVFARRVEPGIELVLPTALLVQLKSWDGEDPRSLRALLAEAPFETASAIASYYLGRPSTPPLALSLEPAWETLSVPEGLRAEIDAASLEERKLLDSIEQVGGEVDSQELMDLERAPMRLRGAYGVAAGRRGAAFSLEKRGLLFPLHPNRYVVPTEVMAVVGAARHSGRERRRSEIRRCVEEQDHLPRRARFSPPPGPLAIAMAMSVRVSQTDIKAGVGTPRSLVARLASRFGRDPEAAALLVALSRVIGLWHQAALSSVTSPGCLCIGDLTPLLFETWRRGGAWDEARPDGECLRIAPENRDPSPVGVVRDMVLDALRDVGQAHWVPYEALLAYVRDDPRAGGVERLLGRWANRASLPSPAVDDLVHRVVVSSLPALGVVDLGGASAPASEAQEGGSAEDLAIRLTARGKSLLGERSRGRPPGSSEFVQPRLLRIGDEARVADVLDLTILSELSAVEPYLELSLPPAALAQGLTAGIEPEQMRARIEAVAPLSDELAAAVKQAGTIVGRGTLAHASGFLWVEDEEVRHLLQTRSPCAELFLEPSPPAGLLVAVGVDAERLVRRCRALGVEVDVEETTYRVRSSTKPPPRTTQTTRRSVSWRPPEVVGSNAAKGRSG